MFKFVSASARKHTSAGACWESRRYTVLVPTDCIMLRSEKRSFCRERGRTSAHVVPKASPGSTPLGSGGGGDRSGADAAGDGACVSFAWQGLHLRELLAGGNHQGCISWHQHLFIRASARVLL